MTADPVHVCPADDVPQDQPMAVKVGRFEIVLLKTNSGIHAFPARCPHRGGPLAFSRVNYPRFSSIPGDMGVPGGWATVVCPWHRWQFRVDSGVEEASGEQMLRCFPVEVIDGEVYVRVGAASASNNKLVAEGEG